MKPSVIFFDLDDTILAFNHGNDKAWKESCIAFAEHIFPITSYQLFTEISRFSDWYWSSQERHREGRMQLEATRRFIVLQALTKLGNPDQETADLIGDYYSKIRYEQLSLFPDSISVLEIIQYLKIPMALLTNGESAVQWDKINRFHLKKYFSAFFVEGDLGFGKPDERVFKLALDYFNVLPADAWMVGDNLEWDVVAPKKLGIFSIWVNPGLELKLNNSIKPDLIIQNIKELPDLLI